MMSTFGKKTFSYASYASFRPSYPQHLYDLALDFHQGPCNLLLDLGCGHGPICRSLAPSFQQVIGIDPSEGMIEQAKLATKDRESYHHVEYRQGVAEDLAFIKDGSVDMVTVGQSVHWFELPQFFREMERVLRGSGTLAFWGYTDFIIQDYPAASQILHEMAYAESENQLGPYWQQPGRSILQNFLRDVQPPKSGWVMVDRQEYDPSRENMVDVDEAGKSYGQSRKGPVIMRQRMPVATVMEYVRTWSSFHGWQQKHPNEKAKSDGGIGDIVDDVFERIAQVEDDWKLHSDWRQKELDIVWGTALILARRRDSGVE